MELKGKKVNFLGDSITQGVGVSAPDKKYVEVFAKKYGTALVRNYGISGTRIARQKQTSVRTTWDVDFRTRLPLMEKEADLVFIFGGTNDSWADCPLGKEQLCGWTVKDLYTVLPAIGYLVHRAKTVLKDTRVIFVINTELKDEITKAIINACRHFGVEYVKLENISKQEGHPNIEGMKQIKDQIINHLKEN